MYREPLEVAEECKHDFKSKVSVPNATRVSFLFTPSNDRFKWITWKDIKHAPAKRIKKKNGSTIFEKFNLNARVRLLNPK